MGMAASQVRLLSLTVRQHTIENRAQYLQAQKLRLSNDSDMVYERYINALDATSLQTRVYNSDGKVNWVNASYNNLMRYNDKNKINGNIYYVQDINDGKLYLPEQECKAYEASGGDLKMFLTRMNVQFTDSVSSDEYIAAKAKVDQDIANGWNTIPYDSSFIENYTSLKSKIIYPEESNVYGVANSIYKIVSGSKNQSTGVYLTSDASKYNELIANLNKLKSTSYYTGVNRTIIDYCLGFNINEIFGNTNNVNSLEARTLGNSELYLQYSKADSNNQSINDAYKLRMMFNGGTYRLNGGASNNIYDNSILTTVQNIAGAKNVGDALNIVVNNIKNAEIEVSTTAAQSSLDAFLASNGTDQSTVETNLSNYEKYLKDVEILNSLDQVTHIEYDNSELGQYYEDMFYAIKSAGGCKVITDEYAQSPTWVHNMIKNAQVILGVYDSKTKELDNTTASSNTGLREVSNDEEIAIADSQYETDLKAITAKENKFQTELNQLEEERNVIQTEIESLKKIAKENIESTFKTFT